MSKAITEQREAIGDKMKKISSGKRWQKRSEAPAEAAETRALLRSQKQQQQWKNNVITAKNWTSITEVQIKNTADTVQRLNELGIQAKNDTLTDQDSKIIAKEVNSLLEGLVTKAKAKSRGKYVFSGTYSEKSPIEVTRNSDGDITAVNANGEINTWDSKKVQVDEASVRDYGALAGGKQGIFMDETHDPTDGDLEPNGSIFDAAIKLRDTLESGNAPDDSTLDAVQQGLDRVTQGLVSNGVNQNFFGKLEEDFLSMESYTQKTISELQNTDIARVSVQLNQLRSSLQASMQMTSMNQGLSLTNYL